MAAAVSTLIFCPLAFQGSRAAVADTSSVSSSAVPLGDLERAAREDRAPDGVAHRSGQAHLDTRTASPDRSLAQTNPSRHASVPGSSGVGREGDCPDDRGGLAFYKSRARFWAHKMGAGVTAPVAGEPRATCPLVHRAVKFWREKAASNRLRYQAWAYQYDWRSWLPAKWVRVARCETGVRWDWNSGAYQGAFGFAVSSWDAFRLPGYPSEAYLATPRQQYEVALLIWRRYGLSGWGCRNA